MTNIQTAPLLRAIRSRLSLTQEQLAERLGVSFATVNRWEGGQRAAAGGRAAVVLDTGAVTRAPARRTKTRSATSANGSSIDEQQEIVAILDAIDRKIDLHRKKRAMLDELFKALLHKLITGEIRVADLDLLALGDDVTTGRRPRESGDPGAVGTLIGLSPLDTRLPSCVKTPPISQNQNVVPVQVGTRGERQQSLDSRLRGNDGGGA